MRNQVLDYYMHDGPTAFRFQLMGAMDDQGARRMEQVWHTACSHVGDRRRIVDITFVTSVEEHGRALLERWHEAGVHFVANSDASRALVESILGAPVAEAAPKTRWWFPFRVAVFRSAASVPFLLAALLFTLSANAPG
jgi:hypothetical protein